MTDSDALSLIDRFGGRAGLTTAVADLYGRLLDDDELAPYFDDIDLPVLRAHMVDFLLAALTGAPQRGNERSLASAHAGRGITDLAFDRVVEHLGSALQDAHVDPAAIDQLVDRVAPLRADVVV